MIVPALNCVTKDLLDEARAWAGLDETKYPVWGKDGYSAANDNIHACIRMARALLLRPEGLPLVGKPLEPR